MLEAEKLQLLESELRNPKPKEHINITNLMLSALNGDYGKHIKGRRDFIEDEIKDLTEKNKALITQIESFTNEKITVQQSKCNVNP